MKEKTVTNRFGPLASLFFYPLLGGFLETKQDASIWGGSNGSRFLSCFLVALARIVECTKNCPGVEVLASDLWEMAWSFRNAEVPEVRMATLVTLATSMGVLKMEKLVELIGLSNLGLNGDGDLAEFLRRSAIEDSDPTCRSLALSLSKNIAKNAAGFLRGTSDDFGLF